MNVPSFSAHGKPVARGDKNQTSNAAASCLQSNVQAFNRGDFATPIRGNLAERNYRPTSFKFHNKQLTNRADGLFQGIFENFSELPGEKKAGREGGHRGSLACQAGPNRMLLYSKVAATFNCYQV